MCHTEKKTTTAFLFIKITYYNKIRVSLSQQNILSKYENKTLVGIINKRRWVRNLLTMYRKSNYLRRRSRKTGTVLKESQVKEVLINKFHNSYLWFSFCVLYHWMVIVIKADKPFLKKEKSVETISAMKLLVLNL